MKETFSFIIVYTQPTKFYLSPCTTTCLPSSYLSMLSTAQDQEGYEGAGVGPQAHVHKPSSSLEYGTFEPAE